MTALNFPIADVILDGHEAAQHEAIGRAAVVALYDELALDPKPGLVSFVDSGSHSDMNAGTFLRSLFALRRYFTQAAVLGADGAPFARLEAWGIEGEARMLAATRGVNTHRGAVFSLGLLCAAAGAARHEGFSLTPAVMRLTIQARWGEALRERIDRGADSQGRRAARRLGLRAAGEEAALGFPALFEHTMPALQAARALGLDDRRARLHALFTAMAVLDDTTLAHRGGLEGLRYAQAAAQGFLDTGGAAHSAAIERAQHLHREFVRRRLSPGGAADMLAAACWLERVCTRPIPGTA